MLECESWGFEVQRFPVFVRMGFFESERTAGQDILVSVDGLVAAGKIEPASESLCDVVDYSKVLTIINEVLQHKEVKLIENAVKKLGDRLMGSIPVLQQVEIKIEKPHLPAKKNRGAAIVVKAKFSRKSEQT